MSASVAVTRAAGQLRQALVAMKSKEIWRQIVEPRDVVFARFRPILEPTYLSRLTEAEVRPFFYFEHNCHWTSLFRQVNRVCGDMKKLRKALAVLLDESRNIEDRLDEVGGSIKGMGKAITTAFLTVAYPEKYGVWNDVSEEALRELGVLPEFERGSSFGARYLKFNAVLRDLRDLLKTDFWTLDALWWQFSRGDTAPGAESHPSLPSTATALQPAASFGLERHLHDFLYDNWEHTPLANEWRVYALPGEPDAGYEFSCEVGRIDILAQHTKGKGWLIVELKRDDTSDEVVGQVLRYMGWVRTKLAKPGEEVRGLIIARTGDPALAYAVGVVPGLEFMTYEVEFRLKATRGKP